LVSVGRGTTTEAVSAEEAESVCVFLTEAAQYGMVVRTVEAPFYRRVALQRALSEDFVPDDRGRALIDRLHDLLGEPTTRRPVPAARTRDGQGIIFVAYNGDVYPSGFLPLSLGNVRAMHLVEIYRTHPLLLDIRAARFTGRCGACEHRQLCGGSRARAYAASGNPLGEDPACVFQPAV
jgi:radical SAM protein with 4Fe4S-binding SPASM domain